MPSLPDRIRLLFITSLVAGSFWFSATANAQTQAPRVVHVIVALADNTFQGIVPVSRAIGNGDDFDRNLYWGAAYGVRTFLKKSDAWRLVGSCSRGTSPVLERCVFRNKSQNTILVADAYRGREIKKTIEDFFAFSAGRKVQSISIEGELSTQAGGA